MAPWTITAYRFCCNKDKPCGSHRPSVAQNLNRMPLGQWQSLKTRLCGTESIKKKKKTLWSLRLRSYLLVKKYCVLCICQVAYLTGWKRGGWYTGGCHTKSLSLFTHFYTLLAQTACKKKLKNSKWQQNARYRAVPSFQHPPAVTRQQMMFYLFTLSQGLLNKHSQSFSDQELV